MRCARPSTATRCYPPKLLLLYYYYYSCYYSSFLILLRSLPCFLSRMDSFFIIMNQSCSSGRLVDRRFLRTSNVLCFLVCSSQSTARLRSSTTTRKWRRTKQRREYRRRKLKLSDSFVSASRSYFGARQT